MKRLLMVFALLVCCIIPVTAYNTGLTPVRGTWNNADGGYFEVIHDIPSNVANCSALGYEGTTDTTNLPQRLTAFNSTDSVSNYVDFGKGSTAPHTMFQDAVNEKYLSWMVQCKYPGNSTLVYVNNGYFYRLAGLDTNVSSDFYATPTSGVGPIYISFWDNSTGYNINAWNWSISPATGWYASAGDMDNEDLVVYFTDAGNYTITHSAANSLGNSDTETKTDYIWIQNSSATVQTTVWAVDMYSGYPIQGAQINIKDVENSSWTNTTAGTNGAGYITTLMHHTLNVYASALGYEDNDLLGLDADGSGYSITLTPTGFANVSAGNTTLYVTVVDDTTTFRIAGAAVTASYANGPEMVSATNAAGVASFVVPNKTNILTRASKSGYISVSKSIYSGTGSGGNSHVDLTINLQSGGTTIPTAVITTLPGGGTPTATPTYLQYCNPSASDYDATKCRQSHSNSSLNFLAENMDNLIMLCVMVTMLYLLGFRLGR